MKATLSNYKQSPRKTRLVTDLVKGKSVGDALTALQFLEKRASDPIAKLIRSAVANAIASGENESELTVKSIRVDKGLVRVTFMPRARGRAFPLKHRMSHITVELSKSAPKTKKKSPSKLKK